MKQSETYIVKENCLKFVCEKCAFICSKNSDYKRHLLTRKHKNGVKCNKNETNFTPITPITPDLIIIENTLYECNCGKVFTNRTTCWRHKKKCIEQNKPSIESSLSQPTKVDEVMILELMKQNQEFKQLILEQQQEMQKQHQESQEQIMTLVKENLGTHHTNSHNNITNNFNLNVFLNEKCKDAMNITDFIDSLQVHFKDLEYNGENGYAAGISKIFLRELNQLDICKRPIHCSDIKREIFHIKNQDTWEKERELLIKCIKQITRKNVILLADWREAHPGCMDLHNSQNDKYNKINCETLGPYLDDEELKCFNKIISSVAKATVIDKKGNSGK